MIPAVVIDGAVATLAEAVGARVAHTAATARAAAEPATAGSGLRESKEIMPVLSASWPKR
ncbi:hypothetical protein acdb102_19550 [Acidothermaceae bacterium B102]|nr:hypothetical protein acdb102_19550 [Acidothermaceae bacterium B102]